MARGDFHTKLLEIHTHTHIHTVIQVLARASIYKTCQYDNNSSLWLHNSNVNLGAQSWSLQAAPHEGIHDIMQRRTICFYVKELHDYGHTAHICVQLSKKAYFHPE